MQKRALSVTAFGFLVLGMQCRVFGQEERATAAGEQHSEGPGCRSSKVAVITDRPTGSSGTETTQCGVIEVLAGPERIWLGHGVHQDGIAPGLQFGLTPRLDLHYARGTYFGLGSGPGPLAGIGDTFVGARYRLSEQRRMLPSFGTFYGLKVPTASYAEGIGSGRYDHSLAFIVSRDAGKAHFDFNVQPNLIGRTDAAGYDQNMAFTLYGFYPVLRGLTFGLGSYGATSLSTSSPAYAVVSSTLNLRVGSRLILDLGFDEGLTSGAPRKRIAFGFSYAVSNVYALIVGPHEKTR